MRVFSAHILRHVEQAEELCNGPDYFLESSLSICPHVLQLEIIALVNYAQH